MTDDNDRIRSLEKQLKEEQEAHEKLETELKYLKTNMTYLFFDETKEPFYIGQTSGTFRERSKQHLSKAITFLNKTASEKEDAPSGQAASEKEEVRSICQF
jgi:hypothetical protein